MVIERRPHRVKQVGEHDQVVVQEPDDVRITEGVVIEQAVTPGGDAEVAWRTADSDSVELADGGEPADITPVDEHVDRDARIVDRGDPLHEGARLGLPAQEGEDAAATRAGSHRLAGAGAGWGATTPSASVTATQSAVRETVSTARRYRRRVVSRFDRPPARRTAARQDAGVRAALGRTTRAR